MENLILTSVPIEMLADLIAERLQRNNEQPATEPEPDSDLIFMDKLCELTNLKVSTIRTMTCQKRIPYIKPKGTKKLMFSRAAIMEWLATGRPTTAETKAEEYLSKPKNKRR